MPRTCPAWLMRWAAGAWSSTFVRAAGHAHAVLGGAEVGGRHDVVRAARDLDQVHQRAASGGVQRRPIDAIRGELTNTVDHALAGGGRFGAERAQELVIGLAGVPMTRAPRTRASCTAGVPTPPAAPLTRTVWSAPTPRRSSARTAVSAAAGSPAASAHESPAGLPA